MKILLSSPLKLILSLALVAAKASTTAAASGCFENAEHFHPDDWAFCQPIAEDVFMYYTPFEEEGNVMLGLHATKDASGWSALALAGNGGMKGASQIVVRRNETDEWIAEDRYSNDYVTPTLDEQQDVKLLFADQTEDGETSWGVLVAMNGCDENDYPIEDKKSYMHWALGSDHSFSYHGSKRGQFRANLMQAPIEDPSTEGLQYVDMLMPDVPVVLGEGGQDPTNPYVCSFFDMEELSEGRYGSNEMVHITRFSPVLADESKQYAHHMLLYVCSEDGSEDDDDFEDDDSEAPMVERAHLSIVPECESMPQGCTEVTFVWAVGGGDIIFPPDVGMPANQGKRWLALQMHYYNPKLDEGVTDNSGVRAYITTDLREQEAGFLAFNGGTGPWQRPPLPSGVSNYHLPTFTIPGGCTQERWTSPLSVLGAFHHMHLYGTKMEISVEREGQNLGPMRMEHHYDFNHQSFEEPSPAMRTLYPGDQIRVNCWYDTMDAPGNVSFGDLTQQEMCYGGIMYWPRQKGDDFGFMLPWADYEMCLQPATNEEFAAHNVSQCAQDLFENVPRFFDFEDWVPEPFGLLTVCNGGDAFAWTDTELPGQLCPTTCRANSNCTSEEIGLFAQEYCTYFCSTVLNVTTYPDLSDTEGHDAGAWGCPDRHEWFKTPPMPDPPICEKAGNPNQVVALQKVEVEPLEGSSGAISAVWSFGVSLVLCLCSWQWNL